jgi:L-ascorbate metabolism protein UlaG (beta-lactamase superfamily)
MSMRRQICVLALTVLLAGGYPAAGGEQPASGANTKTPAELLTGVVHFSDNDVRFCTAEGLRVFVDPVTAPTDGRVVKSGAVKPDLILITHPHADHFQPAVLREYLKLNPKAVLAGPGEVAKLAEEQGINGMKVVTPGRDYTMAGVNFRTVPACFLEGQSHPKASQWVGYVLRLNKTRYYVTGDTEPLPEMAKLQVDVIFPLLYGCGGNLEQALQLAAVCKARLVVPVHTTGPDGLQEDIVKKYLAQLPKTVQGAYYKDAKLIIAP